MKEKLKRVSRLEFIKNQEEYCRKHDIPFFMPSSGYCWGCGEDIVTTFINAGMRGDEELITGCPFCHYSFVH